MERIWFIEIWVLRLFSRWLSQMAGRALCHWVWLVVMCFYQIPDLSIKHSYLPPPLTPYFTKPDFGHFSDFISIDKLPMLAVVGWREISLRINFVFSEARILWVWMWEERVVQEEVDHHPQSSRHILISLINLTTEHCCAVIEENLIKVQLILNSSGEC